MRFESRELLGAEYPPRLRDLKKPPEHFWVVGELPRGPSVAIVGTRKPSTEGLGFARALAAELVREGIVVFSGGAEGIDAAAHEGALDAGGPTVVVAPSSFEEPFPTFHRALFERVVEEGGAYVTASAPGTKPNQNQFFPRNAQLAALTQVLVMVESRIIGGARNAVTSARKLGRPVLCVPGAPWMPASSGCLLEIRRGAGLLTSAADVLAVLGLHPSARSPGPAVGSSSATAPAGDPDPVRARLLSLLSVGPRYPDDLCREVGLPAGELQALLLTLTLEGIVVSDPSGHVSLISA